jgi:hypothetical protein
MGIGEGMIMEKDCHRRRAIGGVAVAAAITASMLAAGCTSTPQTPGAAPPIAITNPAEGLACEQPSPDEIRQALLAVRYWSDRARHGETSPSTDGAARRWHPMAVCDALAVLRCDCNFAADVRLRRARQMITAASLDCPELPVVARCPEFARSHILAESFESEACCAKVTSCLVHDPVDDDDVALIKFTINTELTKDQIAPNLDPRNWDEVPLSWFPHTKYVGDKCPGTCTETDPDKIREIPITDFAGNELALGSPWSGAIFEHFASDCEKAGGDCTRFKNYLHIDAQGALGSGSYTVNYRLCEPDCGSLATQVLGGPELPGGIVSDCGYTKTQDRGMGNGWQKVSGAKQLQFCAEGNTHDFDQMVGMSLELLVAGIAESLCVNAGKKCACTESPWECPSAQIGIAGPDDDDDVQFITPPYICSEETTRPKCEQGGG